MNIILKHTFNSIFKNPIQSLIIVVTMILISACVFCALCMTDIFTRSAERWAYAYTARADIIIKVPLNILETFYENETLNDACEKIVPFIQKPAYVETETKSVRCDFSFTKPNDVITYGQNQYIEKTENNSGLPSVYISGVTARTMGIAAGSVINVSSKYCSADSFFVAGIMIAGGVFHDGDCPVLITDITSIKNVGTTNAFIYLKSVSNKTTLKQSVIKYLNESFNNVRAEDADKSSDIADSARNNESILSVALAVMILLMILILFSAYSVIAKNRVNEIIRFKAAGATPFQCTFILLSEAAIYALIGCPAGLGIGRLLLKAAGDLLLDGESLLLFSAWKYIAALLIGFAAALCACLPPAAAMGKSSVRRLVDSGVKTAKKPSLPLFLISTAALAGIFAALAFVKGNAVMPCAIAAAVLSCFWLASAIPWLIKLFSGINSNSRSRGSGAVAAAVVRNNSSLITLSTLLAVLIAFVWTGSMIVNLVLDTQRNYLTRFTADFSVEFENNTSEAKNAAYIACESFPDVRDICLYDKLAICTINSESELSENLIGFSIEKGEYLKHFIPEYNESYAERFDNATNPVILNRKQAEENGLKIGDKVTFGLRDSSYESKAFPVEFTLVAIDNTVTNWDVHMYFKSSSMADYLRDFYTVSGIYFNGDKAKFTDYRETINASAEGVRLLNLDATRKENTLSDASKLMNFMLFLFYTVAALGLANMIYVVSNSENKHFKDLNLVGMTRSQIFAAKLSEAAIICFSSLICGLVTCIALNQLRPVFALVMEKYVDAFVFPLEMLYTILIISGVFLALWLLNGISAVSYLKKHRGIPHGKQ